MKIQNREKWPASRFLLSMILLSGLTACAAEKEVLVEAASTKDVFDQVQADETVLATVNGSRIGEYDLAVNLSRTLGDDYLQIADSGVEKQVLRSMIASRAIAMKSLKSLSVDEKVGIEKRVAQYREELLVKQYLLENTSPEAVSSQQVEDYYNDNPDQFAGRVERLYEVVSVDPDLYKSSPKQALSFLNRAKTHDDWPALSRETQEQSVPILHSYQTLVGDEALGSIEQALLTLDEGQMSRIVISDGAPYLMRLLKSTRQQDVPLSEARVDIRKILLPATVRKAVREVSDTVLKESQVVLSDAPE